jgi:hypothetical protein
MHPLSRTKGIEMHNYLSPEPATLLERASLGLLTGLRVGPLIAAGARSVMRVLTLAGRRELQFTLRGNLEILGTVMALNILGSILFIFARPYLPNIGLLRGLLYGLGLLLTFGILFFVAENALGELRIGGPRLSIGLFSILLLVYGVLLDLAVTYLQARRVS